MHYYLFPSPSSVAGLVQGDGEEGGGMMEFLPLIFISIYCVMGIIWAWLRLSWSYLNVETIEY
jgi:hypothetical protein